MQESGDVGHGMAINVGNTRVGVGSERLPWIKNPHVLPIDIGVSIDRRPKDTPLIIVEAEVLPLMKMLRRSDLPYNEVGANIYGYHRIDPDTERHYFHIIGILPQHIRQPSTAYSKTMRPH